MFAGDVDADPERAEVSECTDSIQINMESCKAHVARPTPGARLRGMMHQSFAKATVAVILSIFFLGCFFGSFQTSRPASAPTEANFPSRVSTSQVSSLAAGALAPVRNLDQVPSARPAPNWQDWALMDYERSGLCNSTDPLSCFGNGLCVNGRCECDIGWRGYECSQLDLLPSKRSTPGLPMNGSNPSWGGSMIKENNRWYFVAGGKYPGPSMTAPDPLTTWDRSPSYSTNDSNQPFGSINPYDFEINTADISSDDRYGDSYLTIYESEGEDPAGPFIAKQVFRKGFRADLKRHPDTNALLMLVMGAPTQSTTWQYGFLVVHWPGGKLFQQVGNDITLAPYEEHLAYATKQKVNGVLQGLNSHYNDSAQWDCDVKDPSMAIHDDGTTVIAYRGVRCDAAAVHDHTEHVGVLVATDWKGPYTRIGEWLFDDGSVNLDGGNEDLFMWRDGRGTHMILHSQLQDHGYDQKKKRGGYAFSVDGISKWRLSKWELFPNELAWDDGHGGFETQFLMKRQRPSLVFDENGTMTHLITGVDYLFDPCCDWYIYGSAWTYIQPIVTDCNAGSVMNANGQCEMCQPDVLGNGHCEQATTRYGKCVCARCQSGYYGDTCNVAITCGSLQSRHKCSGTSRNRIDLQWNNVTDAASCERACASQQMDGCCYFFNGTGACALYLGQSQISVLRAPKVHSSMCSRPATTTTTTTSTNTTTITTTTTTTTTTSTTKTTTTTTVTTTLPPMMSRFSDDESQRCQGQPVAVGGKTWGGLGAQISQLDCLSACLTEPSCEYSVCRLRSDGVCMQCSAFTTCDLVSQSSKRFAVFMKQRP